MQSFFTLRCRSFLFSDIFVPPPHVALTNQSSISSHIIIKALCSRHVTHLSDKTHKVPYLTDFQHVTPWEHFLLKRQEFMSQFVFYRHFMHIKSVYIFYMQHHCKLA